MNALRKYLAIGFGIGVGAALTVTACLLSWHAWASRSKGWNRSAVTAEFDSVGTEGDDHTVVFRYTLINNTDQDYRLDTVAAVRMAGRLKDQNSLLFGAPSFTHLELPVYAPSRSRVRVLVHSSVPFTSGEPSRLDDIDAYNTELSHFVTTEMGNLGGFVIFDLAQRYEIDLPNGWQNTKLISTGSRLETSPTTAVENSSSAKISPISGDIFDRMSACRTASELIASCKQRSISPHMPSSEGTRSGEIVPLPEPPKGYRLDPDPSACAIAESWLPSCREQKLFANVR